MKQIIVIAICILIIVIGGVYEIKYLQKSSEYLSYDLEYIKNALNNNNYDIANEQMRKLKNTWNQEKKVWQLFVINEEIEDIDNSIAQLEENIKIEMKNEAIVQISLLRNYLTYSYNMQRVKPETII